MASSDSTLAASAHRTVDQVAAAAHAATDRVAENVQQIGELPDRLRADAYELLRRNVLISVGAAFTLGFMLGRFG